MKAKCLEEEKWIYWRKGMNQTYVFSFAIIFTSCTGPNVWKQFSISAPVV
jgi:hypothetical protein